MFADKIPVNASTGAGLDRGESAGWTLKVNHMKHL